ncbi:transcription-repair coupling factor [candidate division WOR-1 bacterium RIFOXYA2_FULL_36_21]|uniref:Transcription-repair-coupling factor n=1 Tax=candidate division WOR-1 bacterium RIFOXYB2_FULL_36_35 TaxID=1802578 RepID=A0A1F4RYX6_UNCSA|nr:MAG: transcription-repair coupling factor [candidate division WOR-1 bacterium RIFOXYA2_FULL_36_21]OGC13382.1 MAG: transcription-repair coupling factor [candidate division WOR-1 bacterium RIFOXYB2_FULL_36_35]OGC21244.1 MAG: transcription-repair coupling factor [candidate division WOR-1 bacterium RIFOXYA12_FULL_36_13]
MLHQILKKLKDTDVYNESLREKNFSGLIGSSKSLVVSSLAEKLKKVAIITTSSSEAQWIKEEISVFYPTLTVSILPAPDALFYGEKVSKEITGKRLRVFADFLAEDKGVLVIPLRSAMYKTSGTRDQWIELLRGEKDIRLDKLISRLIEYDYERLPVVGEHGEFSVRGGIIDIFPSNSDYPFRLEFLGDEIESIRPFDPVTQRSKEKIENIKIFKNNEERDVSLLYALPKETTLIIDEKNILKGASDQLIKDISLSPDVLKDIVPFIELLKEAKKFNLFYFSGFFETQEEPLFYSSSDYTNKISVLEEKRDVLIVTEHPSRFSPSLKIVKGRIRSGFKFGDCEVLSDKELFGVKSARAKTETKLVEGVGPDIRADFNIGDYVVHEDYGVAIYKGLHKIEEGEFILLEFAENDRLYVPPHSMGRVEKYISEEGYRPKLSRMGGVAWKAIKSKVKKSVRDLTKELLALYSERKEINKIPYSQDDLWQSELKDSFPYEETPDQLKAISDIKNDLESDKPMERLLCGDVGYGKTEVAIRAIVKVAQANKQVALLVPTTILADQHYHYLKERLSVFPLKVEMLSRFKSKDEQKKVIEQLKSGEINIIVGTHRLLQKDVHFKDIGLLVVDEEHRFGVSHKEKLKKIKKNIDILSMTATPIPRTLYMSLAGTRDLSLIQTPPADRSPIRTYVSPFDEALVREAILRELDRGGQIFFVHNRIETIDNIAAKIKRLVPEAKLVVAHGRMREIDLEKVMEKFLDQRCDILLCTAIIESGLDIPNANTILIDNAHKLGLAQLYQLRGRVGRSEVRGYAYLLYDPKDIIAENSLARLKAIQEFISLGSGYRLALRDLEIRGSGNLLGAQQHGHMLSVGFDLYCELLDEAVKEIKGIKEPTPRQVVIDVEKEGYIPGKYIEDEQQRIAIYRRLNLLSCLDELKDFKDEIKDRFGKIPQEVLKLFDFVFLKLSAGKMGIVSIRGDKRIVVEWIDGRQKRFKIEGKDRLGEIVARLKSTPIS